MELKFYFWLALFHSIFGAKRLPVVWATFCLIGLASAQYVPSLAESMLIAPYAPMFLCGLVAYAWDDQPRWLSAGLIAGALVIIAFTSRYDGVTILASVVAIVTTAATRLRNISLPYPVVWLGVASYPLYLVHQNIGLVVIRECTGVAPSLRVGLAVAASVALAGLLHRTVDLRYQKRLAAAFDRILSALLNRRAPKPA